MNGTDLYKMSDLQKANEEIISIENMTDQHWSEIRELTQQILKSGQAGRDFTKASIMAFIQWLAYKQVSFGFLNEDSETIH